MKTYRISEADLQGMECLATGYKMFNNDWTTKHGNYDYKDENGNRCLLREVENNFQRVNELSFEPINTDEIYVELKKTHGQPFYSVYEIRCY